MSAAEQSNVQPDDPPALRTAISLLARGLWPIPVYAPGTKIGTNKDGTPKISKGKEPIGEAWGLTRHTPETLRAVWAANPEANVGLRLGKEGGLIDVEFDDREAGARTYLDLMGGEEVETAGWESDRGPHRIFRYDDRLSKYKPIIKGDWLSGLEIRIGANGSTGQQYQSVCPPSKGPDGKPRRWLGRHDILDLPDAFFDYLDRHMPKAAPKATKPRILKFSGKKPVGTWDADDVIDEARRHVRELATEWGVQFTGKVFDGDWAECHAIDRPDRNPSAGVNLQSGVYHDFGTEAPGLSLFMLAVALGAYPDFPTAVNCLGDRLGVKPSQDSGDGFEGSEVYESRKNLSDEEKPWFPPRLKIPVDPVAFPLDVFPYPLADLCRAGASAVQCPPDYFAGAALALAGGVTGLSVNLSVKPHYHEAPNLYLAIVGPPGSKKTPAIKIMARPLFNIDRDLRDEYRMEMVGYLEQKAEWDADRKKGDPGPAPTEPIPRQLTLDDTTREAVAQVHSENERGLVLIKDELTSWVASLDAYRGGKGDDKQFWLKVNSGALVKVNRKGSREPLIVPQPCVTIVGGLTPDMLPTIKSGGDDGWLDRILFAYPEPMEAVDDTDDEIPPDLLDDWAEAVRSLFARPMVADQNTGRLRPWFVRLTSEARSEYRQWINGHRAETRHQDFPGPLRGPWSKMEGFFGRLCLILAQLRRAYDPERTHDPEDVDALIVRDAATLADYFKVHFRRARGDLLRRASVPDDAEAMLRWFRNTGRRQFSERDARLNFPGRFAGNLLALSDAVEWLTRSGCLRVAPKPPQPQGGRPHSPIYDVNPFILGDVPDDEE